MGVTGICSFNSIITQKIILFPCIERKSSQQGVELFLTTIIVACCGLTFHWARWEKPAKQKDHPLMGGPWLILQLDTALAIQSTGIRLFLVRLLMGAFLDSLIPVSLHLQ